MKKVIVSTLITIIVSNNMVYSDTINNEMLEVNNNLEITEVTGEKNEVDSVGELLEETENEDVIQIDTNSVEAKIEREIEENINIEESSHVITQQDVSDFVSLKDAVTKSNIEINITNNIVLKDVINITGKNVIINGGGHTLNLNQGNQSDKSNKFVIKSNDVIVRGLKFENYLNNGISIYRVSGIELIDIELKGRDKTTTLTNEQSKVGIDIYESKVKLDNITSSSHLYTGIQVRGGSIVEVLSKNSHNNDTVHMKTIKSDGELDNTIIDTNNLYLRGRDKVNNDKTTVDCFLRRDVEINTVQDLINNIKNNGNVLHIRNDINLETSNIPQGTTKVELEIGSNILVEGYGNTIDLNKLANITLKGNDIQLKDITIKNAEDIGINIYNSRDIVLNKVNVQKSGRFGIFVNGSSVILEDCSTSDNNGGIIITRSRTLRSKSHIDSIVKVVGSIKQEESNINVGVTNLEMIDGYFQNNQFIVADGIYDKYVNDVESKVLSDYYLDLFGITGDDRNRKYDEETTDYMIIKTVIDVQNHTEVLDENGQPIRLVGDGKFDETENLKKLIEYAASHGKELYFPEGIYKITEDIDLATIKLPALSNFKLTGAASGLSIIDGSSSVDKMLRLVNSEYHYAMNYININNIVFNNVGIEFNGPYKKGITLNNNVFMNGRYTSERDALGNLTKVTMTPYITAKNSKYLIEKNAFLRGLNNPGRGISTYRTKNTTIKDNFFGNLEGLNDAATMLPNSVISRLALIQGESQFKLSDTVKINGSQGNFFTAVNNERYDENITIANNYFNMDEDREISGDFGKDILVSGINAEKDGQRRDHIIYSKGYNNLNIVGNYFKGMENGAAGGVKIRNGVNAYIGSNHFKDVPLLTYIYGDLTKEESLLYNTTIYNNLFHQTTNFGGTGTGILYYQSFRDGDDLTFKDDTWVDAYGDVQNFVIYNNEFMSDDRDQITISNRAEVAYGNNHFLAYGNKYAEYNNVSVNYNSGNFSLTESTEAEVLSKVNGGFLQYNNVNIPLAPAKADYKYLNIEIEKANKFYNELLENGQIGILGGQYSQEVFNELKNLISETEALINLNSLTQWETNKRLTYIQATLEKLKNSINDKGNAPVINIVNDVEISVGDEFDPLYGIEITDDRDELEHLNIIVDIGNFNNAIPGTYTIKYTVVDRDGNITEIRRSVVVKEVYNGNNNSGNYPDNSNPNNNSSNNTSESEILNPSNNSNINTADTNNIFIYLISILLSLTIFGIINRKKKK